MVTHYLVITDEGVKQNKHFNLERGDIEGIKAAVQWVASRSSPRQGCAPLAGCGCKSCCRMEDMADE